MKIETFTLKIKLKVSNSSIEKTFNGLSRVAVDTYLRYFEANYELVDAELLSEGICKW